MRNRSVIAGGIVFLSPFLFFPGFQDEIRTPKLLFFVVAISLYGAYLAAKNLRPSLGLAFAFCSVSAVVSGFSQNYQLPALFFTGVALFSSVLVRRLNEFEIDRILAALMWAGLGNAALAYMQKCGYDPIFIYRKGLDPTIPIGFLGQQTILGAFMVSAFAASLFRKTGPKYWASILIGVPILLTESSFVLASFLTVLLVWVYAVSGARNFLWATGVVLWIGAGALAMNQDLRAKFLEDNGRFEMWRNIAKASMKRPLLGHGFGTFMFETKKSEMKARLVYDEVRKIKSDPAYAETGWKIVHANTDAVQSPHSIRMHGLYLQAHNDFLERFYECGIVGLFLIGYLLYDFAKMLFRYRDRRVVLGMGAILLGTLVNALGSFPFRLAPMGFLALWAFVIVTTFRMEPRNGDIGAVHT